tara:strand:- start:292 stop:492 length:201 start_codon:yes stop_codon:yes gene_type:complete
MFKGDVMEILNIKSKYELGRGLNKNNFEIRKVVKGSKKELIGELNKFPFNKDEYVMVVVKAKEFKL